MLWREGGGGEGGERVEGTSGARQGCGEGGSGWEENEEGRQCCTIYIIRSTKGYNDKNICYHEEVISLLKTIL